MRRGVHPLDGREDDSEEDEAKDSLGTHVSLLEDATQSVKDSLAELWLLRPRISRHHHQVREGIQLPVFLLARVSQLVDTEYLGSFVGVTEVHRCLRLDVGGSCQRPVG